MSSKYPEFYIVIDFLEYRFLCLRIFSIDAATHTLHRKANNIWRKEKVCQPQQFSTYVVGVASYLKLWLAGLSMPLSWVYNLFSYTIYFLQFEC